MTSQETSSSKLCTVSGVTSDNYQAKAGAFMKIQQQDTGEYGKAVNPRDQPQAWGAWKGYFRAVGKNAAVHRMGQIERSFLTSIDAKHSNEHIQVGRYTVPASMPSDFDDDREWHSDKFAGDHFLDDWAARKKRWLDLDKIAAEVRKTIVAAAMPKGKRRPGQATDKAEDERLKKQAEGYRKTQSHRTAEELMQDSMLMGGSKT